MDAAALEAALTPRTKAVLPVHLYGRVADVDAIASFAARHGLLLVEDCAQAHGASLAGPARRDVRARGRLELLSDEEPRRPRRRRRGDGRGPGGLRRGRPRRAAQRRTDTSRATTRRRRDSTAASTRSRRRPCGRGSGGSRLGNRAARRDRRPVRRGARGRRARSASGPGRGDAGSPPLRRAGPGPRRFPGAPRGTRDRNGRPLSARRARAARVREAAARTPSRSRSAPCARSSRCRSTRT